MRDPEMFKYDVRVRERMLRAGRITNEDVGRILDALPDLEGSIEAVPLNQPALDVSLTASTVVRQTFASVSTSDDRDNEEPGDGESA